MFLWASIRPNFTERFVQPIKLFEPFKKDSDWLIVAVLYESIEHADDSVALLEIKFVLKIESNTWEGGLINGFFTLKQIEKPWMCSVLL